MQGDGYMATFFLAEWVVYDPMGLAYLVMENKRVRDIQLGLSWIQVQISGEGYSSKTGRNPPPMLLVPIQPKPSV